MLSIEETYNKEAAKELYKDNITILPHRDISIERFENIPAITQRAIKSFASISANIAAKYDIPSTQIPQIPIRPIKKPIIICTKSFLPIYFIIFSLSCPTANLIRESI